MNHHPRLTEQRSQDRRFGRRGLLALAVIVSVVWLATLYLESGMQASALWSSATRGGTSESDRLLFGDPDDTVASEPLDESVYLPYEVKGWRMAGPQPVPGAESVAVECWLNPQDDERNLVTPLVIYVQAHRYPGVADAELGLLMKRYSEGAGDTNIAGVQAKTGRTGDFGSVVIAWTEPDVLYYVDATFTHYVPEHSVAEEILKAAAEEVASAVALYRAAQGGAQ